MNNQETVTAATREPRDVVEAYFAALADGRVADALATLSPQVQWTQPGRNRFSGVHHTPEGVAALVGKMMEVSEGSFVLTVAGSPMQNGDDVAVPVRFAGVRNGGLSMDQPGIDLLTVEQGQIVAVRLFSSDPAQEDRFWGVDA